MAQTLFRKVWDAHTVRKLPSGQTQLFVGRLQTPGSGLQALGFTPGAGQKHYHRGHGHRQRTRIPK